MRTTKKPARFFLLVRWLGRTFIGALKEGYEASFLAREGNPLGDLQNVRKIKLRFKQGLVLEPY